MPELPEVETSRRGHRTASRWCNHSSCGGAQRTLALAGFRRDLPFKRPTQCLVQRRAKYLLLELPEGWIIIHLGMSGSLRILPEELPLKSMTMWIW